MRNINQSAYLEILRDLSLADKGSSSSLSKSEHVRRTNSIKPVVEVEDFEPLDINQADNVDDLSLFEAFESSFGSELKENNKPGRSSLEEIEKLDLELDLNFEDDASLVEALDMVDALAGL
jgi:hypothetical protein